MCIYIYLKTAHFQKGKTKNTYIHVYVPLLLINRKEKEEKKTLKKVIIQNALH